MNRLYWYILGFWLLSLNLAVAQDKTQSTEQIIADIFEQYTAETDEAIDFESFYDELHELAISPINLNKATKEDLDKLIFISDTQVENILYYIYRFGPLNTIYELQLVEGLDMTDIRNMLAFVYVGDEMVTSQKIYKADLFKYGKNEVLYRLDRGLESKRAYQPDNSSSDKFQGSAFYNSFKYHFRFKDRISAGLTMEKDAGEQLLDTSHVGYDFYSFHVQLNDFGKFKTIVLGDFKANFGLGLVMSSGFGMGKSSYVLNVIPHNTGLKKFSSTNESDYLRGAGATLKFGKFDFSAFYSNRMTDGDTLTGSFQSFYKTGLHRTDAEIAKKHTINQQLAGVNTTFTHAKFQLGFTVVHTFMDQRLEPEVSNYNQFYFRGNKQTTAGLNYRFRLSRLNFFGESACSNNQGFATVNGVSFSPVSQVSLVGMMRYFSKKFDTFYANTFSEGSRISNETGYYLGAEIRPYKKWKIAAYADSYRFPWLKFGVDAPSLGQDYLLQADFVARRDLAMFWRFKIEEKQISELDLNQNIPALKTHLKASLRYQLTYSFGSFNFRNVLEGNMIQHNNLNTYGLSAFQDVSYTFSSMPLKIDLRYQFFDAADYDNRFYTYEKDVLYAFAIPMYYGVGNRYYLNLKYDLNKNITFWMKFAQTVYADYRETIGSGNEEIQGNRKSDIRFLLRYEF